MKRFLLVFLMFLCVSSLFAQRLWVKEGYIRVYNPTSKQDFFYPTQSISKIYIKGDDINVYMNGAVEFSLKYSSLTQYNGGAVPSLADIGVDLAALLHSPGWSAEETDVATNDSVLTTTTYYSVYIPSTCVWNTAFSWTKNDDSLSIIPLISVDGIRTLYPGLDTIVSTSSADNASFDDSIFSGDTLIFQVISTDTTIFDKIVNKQSR